jgi:hypothetical protein
MPNVQTKHTWKTYLFGFLVIFLLRYTSSRLNHGKVDQFIFEHFWLVVFLPTVLFVLFRFVRFYYLEYRN